ncbi:cytochrome b5 [Argentina anserina]|uniref:cytochrome b5 n=1 Tax=Argentina anserina TaxID=57926 RepID=UPI0021767C61|nr:cytochrome b5 [Potentilla anserina]XP_050373450.1 cytochrome b5 [Potentilla anserina]
MPTLTKLYTMKEASQHNTKDDCWIVIDGKVYDVSTYMDDHPGGDDVILATTGQDATDEFEDAGHSKSAKELMETMCIGELDTDVDTTDTALEDQPTSYPEKLMTLTKQYWAVPAAVVGISVVVGILYLRKK